MPDGSSDPVPSLSIDVQGIPVAYEVRGTGIPILMVHGWSADRRYMVADLEPVFADDRRWQRVYLDLPGHGATPAPRWLGSQDQMLCIVSGFIDAVLPDTPLAIVGSSYGGYTALGVVRLMPERLLGACLLVPDMPSEDNTRDTPEAVVLSADESIFEGLPADQQWMRDALVVQERWMVDELLAHDSPAYRIADYAFLDRLNASYLPSGVARRPGAAFTGPSLILTGRQDSTVGYRGAWALLEDFPRATYAVLDLAGHQLGRVERPIPFRVLVGDWLDRMGRERPTDGTPGSDS